MVTSGQKPTTPAQTNREPSACTRTPKRATETECETQLLLGDTPLLSPGHSLGRMQPSLTNPTTGTHLRFDAFQDPNSSLNPFQESGDAAIYRNPRESMSLFPPIDNNAPGEDHFLGENDSGTQESIRFSDVMGRATVAHLLRARYSSGAQAHSSQYGYQPSESVLESKTNNLQKSHQYSPLTDPMLVRYTIAPPQMDPGFFLNLTTEMLSEVIFESSDDLMDILQSTATPRTTVDVLARRLFPNTYALSHNSNASTVIARLVMQSSLNEVARLDELLSLDQVIRMATHARSTRYVMQAIAVRQCTPAIAGVLIQYARKLAFTSNGVLLLIQCIEHWPKDLVLQMMHYLSLEQDFGEDNAAKKCAAQTQADSPLFDVAFSQFGNYVLQALIRTLTPPQVFTLVHVPLLPYTRNLAMSKHGSHLVEELFSVSQSRTELIKELLTEDKYITALASSSYGNYVIQAIIKTMQSHREATETEKLIRSCMTRSKFIRKIETQMKGWWELNPLPDV